MTPARWRLAADICQEAQTDGRLGAFSAVDVRHAEAALRYLAALDEAILAHEEAVHGVAF